MTEKLEELLTLGRVLADSPSYSARPTLCTVEVTKDLVGQRGIYVYIDDEFLNRRFVGRLIDGPYFFEDKPNHPKNSVTHFPKKVCIVELTSILTDGVPYLVQTRPSPGSKAFLMPPEAVQDYLGAQGDLFYGRLTSDMTVRLCFDSRALTRHIGIFGTTGSGKSNTLQVVAEEASRIGFAVIIFDVEGEYIRLDEPTSMLRQSLGEFGEEPSGVRDSLFYVPASGESIRSEARKFAIPFPEVNLDVFGEVLGLNTQERLMFLDLIRKTKEYLGFQPYTLKTVVEKLGKQLEGQAENPTLPDAISEASSSLYAKLVAIEKLGIMDADFPEINVGEIIVPGRVSIIDLSESTDSLRNVVIAYYLDSIFRAKIRDAEHGKFDSPLLILIEEVHTFISREKKDRMLGTLTLMTELARRGRKRGICLGLVSQQPVRLPPELFETINTRVIHRLSSIANIKVLKESTGNVPDSYWQAVPSFSKGEALVVSPTYNNAVVARVRPAASKRLTSDLEPASKIGHL